MRNYVRLTCVIFVVVALVHAARLALDWPLIIGNWDVPQWISLFGVVGPGALSAWALRLWGGTS